MVRIKHAVTAASIALASGLAAADVSYTFSGHSSMPAPLPTTNTNTLSFVLQQPTFLSGINVFSPASLLSCDAGPGWRCDQITTYADATGAGLTTMPGMQAIEFATVSNASGSSSNLVFYFGAPAFSTPGTYTAVASLNPGSLTVAAAVPEPSTAIMFGLGLALTAGLARRPSRAR